jgi:tetratricopeptide (TPR) repeat protein
MRLRLLILTFALLAACSKSREADWDRAMKGGASAMGQSNFREAITQFNTALDAAYTFPEDHRIADTMTSLAAAHAAAGDLNEAGELYQRALPMQRQFYGSDSEQAATTLSNLGSLYQDAGRIDEAEAAYNEAMVMRAKVLGKQHPDYANTLMLFASLRRQMGRDVEAEDLNKQALTVCQATGQQRCAATVFDNLGSLYFDKGRFPEALDVFTKGREAWKALAGDQHLDYAISTANLARTYQQQKNYKAAEPLLKEALVIFDRAYGEDGPELVTYYLGYAQLLKSLNRRDEGEAYERKAATIQALNSRQ